MKYPKITNIVFKLCKRSLLLIFSSLFPIYSKKKYKIPIFFYSLQFHVDPAGMDILRCLQLQVDAAEMVISIVHSFNLKLQICSNETHPNKSIQINNGMVKAMPE